MLARGVLVQGWIGVCVCCFFLCASLSLLNASSLLIVRPLSMGGAVMVLFCCHELSGVVATPFSDCDVLVVRPSLDLTSCFATISARPFYV